MIRNLNVTELVNKAEAAYVAVVQGVYDSNPIPGSITGVSYPAAAMPLMNKEAFKAFATELNTQLRALGVLVDD